MKINFEKCPGCGSHMENHEVLRDDVCDIMSHTNFIKENDLEKYPYVYVQFMQCYECGTEWEEIFIPYDRINVEIKKRYAEINGKLVEAPKNAIAWKYGDPIESSCWIYSEEEALEIEDIDPNLIEWVE